MNITPEKKRTQTTPDGYLPSNNDRRIETSPQKVVARAKNVEYSREEAAEGIPATIPKTSLLEKKLDSVPKIKFSESEDSHTEIDLRPTKEVPEKHSDDKRMTHMSNEPTQLSKEAESTMEGKGREQKRYKIRLFVGEKRFSYTRALLEKHYAKHPNLGRSIIATAYEKKEDLATVKMRKGNKRTTDLTKQGSAFQENEKQILSNGGEMHYEIDATQLETYPFIKQRRIKRIHFNCPHTAGTDEELRTMILKFFKSAGEIQREGDRLHVVLVIAKKETEESKEKIRKKREGETYGIPIASRTASYNLIKKRSFGSDRYPGYEHERTADKSNLRCPASFCEYIFEKMSKSTTPENYVQQVEHGKYFAFPEMSIVDESSSYEDHSSNES